MNFCLVRKKGLVSLIRVLEMNPLTQSRNLAKLCHKEIDMGVVGTKASFHRMYKDSAWIYIGGLNYQLTEGDVTCVFSQYGEIANINLVRNKQTGKSQGFAFLCYEDQRSTDLAVDNLNGIKLCERTIRVEHCSEYRRPKEKGDEDEETRQLWEHGVAPKPGDRLTDNLTLEPKSVVPESRNKGDINGKQKHGRSSDEDRHRSRDRHRDRDKEKHSKMKEEPDVKKETKRHEDVEDDISDIKDPELAKLERELRELREKRKQIGQTSQSNSSESSSESDDQLRRPKKTVPPKRRRRTRSRSRSREQRRSRSPGSRRTDHRSYRGW